jgi:hypothetical protein
MLLEVVPEPPLCHEYDVDQFSVLAIPMIGLGEYLIDIIYRSLILPPGVLDHHKNDDDAVGSRFI